MRDKNEYQLSVESNPARFAIVDMSKVHIDDVALQLKREQLEHLSLSYHRQLDSRDLERCKEILCSFDDNVAGEFIKEFNRKIKDLKQSLSGFLGEFLYALLPEEEQNKIIELLRDNDILRTLVVLNFAEEPLGYDNKKLLLPWELLRIPSNRGQSELVLSQSYLCRLTGETDFAENTTINVQQRLNILIVDASDEQSFFNLLHGQHPEQKLSSQPNKDSDGYFLFSDFVAIKVLGDGVRSEKASLTNINRVLSSSSSPDVIHYFGQIEEVRGNPFLKLIDDKEEGIELQIDKKESFKSLFDSNGYPRPKSFIIQSSSSQDNKNLLICEKATLFFSKFGLPTSCFVPYNNDITCIEYFGSLYPTERETKQTGIQDFSLVESIHRLRRDYINSQSDFLPLLYLGKNVQWTVRIQPSEKIRQPSESSPDDPVRRAIITRVKNNIENLESVLEVIRINGIDEQLITRRRELHKGLCEDLTKQAEKLDQEFLFETFHQLCGIDKDYPQDYKERISHAITSLGT